MSDGSGTLHIERGGAKSTIGVAAAATLTAATFTLIGDSAAASTRMITTFRNFPYTISNENATLTFAAGTQRTFNLISDGNGALKLAARFYNFNSAASTINISPQSVVVTVRINGTLQHNYQTMLASAAIVQMAADNHYLVMESDHAAYGIGLNSTARVFHYGHRAPAAVLAQYRAAALDARYLIPAHAAKGYYTEKANVHNSRLLSNPNTGCLR